MRKLKLIWDFRGLNAEKTAQHHELHLKDYLKVEEVFFAETGHHVISDLHTIAYLIVNESDMRKIRDDLKPHRGEVYEE
jgi:hypothetical protein